MEGNNGNMARTYSRTSVCFCFSLHSSTLQNLLEQHTPVPSHYQRTHPTKDTKQLSRLFFLREMQRNEQPLSPRPAQPSTFSFSRSEPLSQSLGFDDQKLRGFHQRGEVQ